MDRQALNIERNQRFLGSLNEKYKDQLPSTAKSASQHRNKTNQMKVKMKRRIMIVMKMIDVINNKVKSSDDNRRNLYERNVSVISIIQRRRWKCSNISHNPHQQQQYTKRIQSLMKRYPHRENQIRNLSSILSSTISISSSVLLQQQQQQVQDEDVYVPSPIFCLGPHSTGKTSIVCDVVEVLLRKQEQDESTKKISAATTTSATTAQQQQQQQASPLLKAAYVDCSILEPSSIERLVYMVYQQLRPTTTHH